MSTPTQSLSNTTFESSLSRHEEALHGLIEVIVTAGFVMADAIHLSAHGVRARNLSEISPEASVVFAREQIAESGELPEELAQSGPFNLVQQELQAAYWAAFARRHHGFWQGGRTVTAEPPERPEWLEELVREHLEVMLKRLDHLHVTIEGALQPATRKPRDAGVHVFLSAPDTPGREARTGWLPGPNGSRPYQWAALAADGRIHLSRREKGMRHFTIVTSIPESDAREAAAVVAALAV